ncbi:MAG: hypothetical protein AAF985_06285, partial [Bacteroidota bacterium]
RISQPIDPLTNETNLGEFILSEEQNLRTISGTLLDCNNQAIAEGYVKVSTGSSYNIFYVAEDGSFDASFVSCSENEEIEIIGVNMTNAKQSQVFQYIVGNNIDAGNLLACSDLEEYISFDLDGIAYLLLEPFGQKDPNQDRTRLGADWNGDNIVLNEIEGSGVGNFNLKSLNVNDLTSQDGVLPNVTVTFNAYGAVEELITGIFEGDFVDSDGGSHVIKGSFHIQRDN